MIGTGLKVFLLARKRVKCNFAAESINFTDQVYFLRKQLFFSIFIFRTKSYRRVKSWRVLIGTLTMQFADWLFRKNFWNNLFVWKQSRKRYMRHLTRLDWFQRKTIHKRKLDKGAIFVQLGLTRRRLQILEVNWRHWRSFDLSSGG